MYYLAHLAIMATSLLVLIQTGNATIITDKEVVDICREYKKKEEFKYFFVPCSLVSAIGYVESRYNTKVYNPEKSGSYGMLQIQCTTARMLGLKYSCEQLYDKKINVRFGMKYLMYLTINNYTNVASLPSLIAAYNSGTAIYCKRFNPGKCYPNEFINHDYVQKVYRHYEYLLDYLKEEQ